MRPSLGKLIVMGLCMLLEGLAGAALPPMGQALTGLSIETPNQRLLAWVEVAADRERRQQGLMERTALAPDAGMLFLFDEPQAWDAGFWMFRTLLPLDIAFLDQEGRILAIRQMVPCPSTAPRNCPLYRPGVPYRAALEVNLGYFTAHGIRVGDWVRLDRLRH